MTATGKLPDPDENNRNTERRFSHDRKLELPAVEDSVRLPSALEKPIAEHPETMRILELRASKSFIDAVQILADHEQISKADIIRKAVSLYARAKIKSKEGMSIGFIAFSEDNEPEIKQIIDL